VAVTHDSVSLSWAKFTDERRKIGPADRAEPKRTTGKKEKKRLPEGKKSAWGSVVEGKGVNGRRRRRKSLLMPVQSKVSVEEGRG